MNGVGGGVYPPAGDGVCWRRAVWHWVDSHGSVFEFIWCDFPKVVHHRLDRVDKTVGAATFSRDSGTDYHRAKWTSRASVNPGHTPTLIACSLLWSVMRARHRQERICTKVGCQETATATLTYVYADQEAVVGPLALHPEPHSYDLCPTHAERMTAPQGWRVVRYQPRPDDG